MCHITYCARVALQEFDFLIKFDVVCPEGIHLTLEHRDGLLLLTTFLYVGEDIPKYSLNISLYLLDTILILTASSSAFLCLNLSLWLDTMGSRESAPEGSAGRRRGRLGLVVE